MSKILKNKTKIIAWLEQYEIKNYTLIEDKQGGFIVNVDGEVDLREKELTHISVQFGRVSGSFYCSYNKLISLKGSPTFVGEGFTCSGNELTSLHYAPKSVGSYFDCSSNQLASLKGSPESVNGYFSCLDNKLINLEGSPIVISGSFYCRDNQLVSLEGGPISVGKHFNCSYNPALGEYQNTNDFVIIKEKIISDNEKRVLSNLLDKSKLTSSIIKI